MFKKQKPLLPSLREKKRYIVFELKSEKNIPMDQAKNAIKNEAELFLGKLTLAKSGLIFLDDWKSQRGIIKINNKYEDHIKAVFTQINKIQNQNILFRSIGISGVLNKARRKYFGG